MAFSVHTPDRDGPPAAQVVADRRLYLAADLPTVVEDGDPRAAFLLAPAGGAIEAPDVARLRLSLVDGRVVQGDVPPEALKAAAPDEDKQVAPAEDKAAKGGKRDKGIFRRGE